MYKYILLLLLYTKPKSNSYSICTYHLDDLTFPLMRFIIFIFHANHIECDLMRFNHVDVLYMLNEKNKTFTYLINIKR